MKLKVAETEGLALDWMVAAALKRGPQYNHEGFGTVFRGWWLTKGGDYERMPAYSTDFSQGARILEMAGIATRRLSSGTWQAMLSSDLGDSEAARWSLFTLIGVPASASTTRQCRFTGPTQLSAGLRCYAASVLGEVVEVPDALAQCIECPQDSQRVSVN